MRLWIAAAVATTCLGLPACTTQPAELSDAERAEIVAAVEARVAGYRDAALRLDYDALRTMWAEVDGFRIAADGELGTRDLIEEDLRSVQATAREMLRFEFSEGQTHVLGPDAAVHSTRFRWAFVTVAGDTVRSRGSWSYTFQRIGGLWQVVHSGGTHLPD